VCQSILLAHSAVLLDSRAYTFIDTFMLTVFAREDEVSSTELIRIANELINSCERQEMKVRAFLTYGVESDEDITLQDIETVGSEEVTYRHLFGVNTAVVSADLGEHSHLTGTLFVADFIWKAAGSPTSEATFLISEEDHNVFCEKNGRYFSMTKPNECVELKGSMHMYHRLRS
jgi:hypothetical protein